MTTATQREKRIAELREYARLNFNSILEGADKDIRSLGWERVDDPNYRPDRFDSPMVERRDMGFIRPWGDFLLLLTDRAVEQYYVTEATAESYAKVALKPFLSDFAKWKYRLRKDHSGPQFRRM
ncbi:MAG: hypothetical protein ABSE82_11410 [Nitrososphaerales archaeon]